MPGNSPAFFFYIYRKMATKKDVIAAGFFQRYINEVKEDDVVEGLKKNTDRIKKFLKEIPKKKIDFAYAKGKWTIKELLQHMIDAERVFAYRALRFARKDATPLPGFEENDWAANAPTWERKWSQLFEEFKAVRKSNEMMFRSFNKEQLLQKGIASGQEINVIALGFIISGHVEHHINIIKERYL
jgi:DinB superfamily